MGTNSDSGPPVEERSETMDRSRLATSVEAAESIWDMPVSVLPESNPGTVPDSVVPEHKDSIKGIGSESGLGNIAGY